jgi:hypothetical protein
VFLGVVVEWARLGMCMNAVMAGVRRRPVVICDELCIGGMAFFWGHLKRCMGIRNVQFRYHGMGLIEIRDVSMNTRVKERETRC